MGRFLLVFLYVAVTLYGLVDVSKSPSENVRVMPKLLWSVVIFLLGPLGAGAWFLFGRPVAELPPSSGGDGGRGVRPWGPLPPDDDPEFLKRLDEQSWAAKMERLRREREDRSSPGRSDAGGSGAESPPDPAQP